MAEKIQLFQAGDQIMTPEGPVTVLEVRGRGWQKTEGTPKTWWKTEDLIELNPDFAKVYNDKLAAEEARKADRAAGGPGKKIEKLTEQKTKLEARITALGEKLAEVTATIEALEKGEEPPAKTKKTKTTDETQPNEGDPES